MAKFSQYATNIFLILLLLQFAPPLIKSIKRRYEKLFELKTEVAYLPIKGIITDSAYYIKYLKKYFENPDIKAILLKIESPGGAAGTAETIAHEIAYYKKEHPKLIISLSENILTSAAYFIAAATDHIIVSPSTIVGSIGCALPYQFKLHDFIEHYNIHYNNIKAGEYKSIVDPFVNNTSNQNALLQSIADDSYKNFIEYVAQRRPKLTIARATEWADGKVFTGKKAKEIGLIDEVGARSNAVKKIKAAAIIKGPIEWVKPERMRRWWNIFSSDDDENQEESVTSKLMHQLCSVIEQRYGSARLS